MALARKLGVRPLLDSMLARVAARIAPLVSTELSRVLESELERHFNQQLLPELYRRADDLLARGSGPSRVYRPNNIVAGTTKGEFMTASNALARDFLHPEYLEFCRIFNEPMVLLHRKAWERAFIYQRLCREGVLRSGMRGLGFGVGNEKLPSFFAGLGASITATDMHASDWHSFVNEIDYKNSLFYEDLIDRETFDQRVSFEFSDMNQISAHLVDYDFCWSSCSLEHLGSLQNGLDFVVNSIERCLKIGGIACHTTELNLSSEDDTIETGATVIYRKKDLQRLHDILVQHGHWVEPLRIEPGALPPDYIIDLPPYCENLHLKVLLESYVTTSVGLLARRGR